MKSSVDFLTRRLLACVVCSVFAVSVVWAERVSQEDAAVVANNFMNVASASTGAQKAPAKRMVLKSCAPVQAAENQYYIYENASGEGWVMVAANDAVRPILAYSETGHFRTDNMPRNIKGWLQGYDKQIKYVAAHRAAASEEVQREWTRLRSSARATAATPVVAPLIETGWNQDAPYWNLCPTKDEQHCYTGCVATSMAQVMKYWEWPKQGIGSHTIPGTTYSANFGATTYDWANMKNSYSGSSTAAQKTAVATLMYHCGVAVEMEYGTADEGGSGAYSIDWNGYWSSQGIMCAETALKQFFGYNSTVVGYYRDGSPEDDMRSWTKSEWIAMLKEELDAARPIMYAGVGFEVEYNEQEHQNDTSYYGHSFVCDGYDSDDYFHFNWGWSNWGDGYYEVDALAPTETGAGAGNGEYNLQQDVIVGIQPPVAADTVEVVWMVGNTPFETTESYYNKYVLPSATPAACDNKEFVGWCTTANYSSETTAPAFVKNGDALTADTCYAVFATLTQSQQAEVSDVLTREVTGVAAKAEYVSWSGKTVTSDAVYAGKSAGDKGAIQIRTKNNDSGIITTASGGKLKKVTVAWNTGTTSGRTLDIYGKNSAYSAATDLYEQSTQGTKLGSIAFGSGTELTITGDYTYVGLRSKDGAMYFDSITITWEGAGMSYSGYTTECGDSPQDVENVATKPSAVKMLRDGQMVIIRGNAVYSITGARIE